MKTNKKQRFLIKKNKRKQYFTIKLSVRLSIRLYFNGFHKDLEIQFLHVIGDDH